MMHNQHVGFVCQCVLLLGWAIQYGTCDGLLASNSSRTVAVLRGSSPSIPQDRALQENPAFTKCYNSLYQVVGGETAVSQEDYLEFLSIVTDSKVKYDNFSNLPVLYVLIFYTSACVDAIDCKPGSTPSIDIGESTENPSASADLLCKSVLSQTESETSATFQYSIRYDPDVVDAETLGTCLSTATVNLLLDRVAGCPLLTEIVGEPIGQPDPARRRRDKKRDLLPLSTLDFALSSSGEQQRDRKLQTAQGTAVSALGNNDCGYEVRASIDAVDDLDCNEDITVGAGGECGLVRASVDVTTSRLVEPFDNVLNVQTIEVLRTAINGDEFAQYFPPGPCFER